MPDGNLYRDDVHAWALDQANRLRAASRVQAPELEGVDFEHVIEEVEDVGVSERRKVERYLELALRHLIKISAYRDPDPVNHWKKEVNAFLDHANDAYTPSMDRYLNFETIWAKARKRSVRDLGLEGVQTPDIPVRNPFICDDLIDEDFDVESLIGKMRCALSNDLPDSDWT